MSRFEVNQLIINYLKEFINRKDTKDLRFFQILHILNLSEVRSLKDGLLIKDKFSEESVQTLHELMGGLEKFK